MDFEKPQDYVDALKRLDGFPLMGMEMDSPVDHIIDQGDHIHITTEKGSAVELLFKEGDSDD